MRLDKILLKRTQRSKTSTDSQRGEMSMCTMPRDVCPPPPLLLLLFLSVFGASHACLQDPASAYRFTGTVCRLTYPAAVVCEWDFDPVLVFISKDLLHSSV